MMRSADRLVLTAVLALSAWSMRDGYASAQGASALRGLVVEDHTGAPAARAVVRLSQPAGPPLAETDTDRSGRFALTGLPPGEYALEIGKPNYVPVVGRILVGSESAAGAGEDLTVRLVRTGVIAGRFAGAQTGSVIAIERVPRGTVPRTFTARLNVRGEFRLFGLPPARYVVGVLNPSIGAGGGRGLVLYPGSGSPHEFSISGGEEYEGIDLRIPPAETFDVRGQVIAERVADPFRPRAVLVPADDPSVQVWLATTDDEGRFEIEGVLPGEYELLVSRGMLNGNVAPRFFGRTRVSIGWGDIDGLAIPTTTGRTVELELRPRGSACGSAPRLALLPLERFTAEAEVSLPIAEGSVIRVERLAPGRYQLQAASSQSRECHAAMDEVLDLADGWPSRDEAVRRTVVTGGPGAIHGQVVGAGDPASLTLVLTDVTPGRAAPIRIALADSAARFVFDDLPPGQYHLAAHDRRGDIRRWAPETGRADPVIRVEPGATQDVRMSTAPGQFR